MAAITLVQIDAVAQSSSTSPIQFHIHSLPDPANDDNTTSSSSSSSSSSPRDYILISRSTNNNKSSTTSLLDIHEVQTVLPHSGKYASYFVGSRIISNPLLHISTRVDPLFFALAHFQRIKMSNNNAGAATTTEQLLTKWQPYDQVLGLLPSTILHALSLDPNNLTIRSIHEMGQLAHILDVSDMCGDDLILCKFSDERTMQWLVAKFQRSVEALRMRFHEKRRRAVEMKHQLSSLQGGGSGAYSSSFNIAEEEEKGNGNVSNDTGMKGSEGGGEVINDSSALTNEEEQSLKVAGLQLICDYIPTEWRGKLCKEVGLDDMAWMGKKKKSQYQSSTSTGDIGEDTAAGEKRSRAAWEGILGQDDADALLQYTQGSSSSGGKASSSDGVTSGKKSTVQDAKSVGLKKLAKVNTKGMKSLSSFFGAGGKTKKTT
jgi:hypothetical protein